MGMIVAFAGLAAMTTAYASPSTFGDKSGVAFYLGIVAVVIGLGSLTGGGGSCSSAWGTHGSYADC